MTWIWAFLIILGVVTSIFTGNISQVEKAIITGSGGAFELILSIGGAICLWSGLMKIAEASGITNLIAKLLSPITGFLFPKIKKDGAAMKAITMNITANLLGLGNAATPLGLIAMKELKLEEKVTNIATNNMAMFIVVNTACIQLVPVTIAALRQQYGSNSPMDIMPAIWISSAAALTIGVIIAKVLGGKNKCK